MPCNIVPVGKRRDGGTRYWCLFHKADATAKYGKRAEFCRYAHIKPPTSGEIFRLFVRDLRSGIALWGAVPPIYDTTTLALERGVHVHVRKLAAEEKIVDETYRLVVLADGNGNLLNEAIEVSELDAIYFMVSNVFGFKTKYIECTYCKYPHLDKDWFSVHPHRRHLCSGCGRNFRDNEIAIGNPLADMQNRFVGNTNKPISAPKTKRLKQADYPNGIQIWGSNPAIIWTSRRKEHSGIHVHAYGVNDKEHVDDTFSEVWIDDEYLDPLMVRVLMAQSALPHLDGRVVSLDCPKCSSPHFDYGELAFTPHEEHICLNCGCEFSGRGRVRKVISNPLIRVLEKLGAGAPIKPRKHDIGLLPETI